MADESGNKVNKYQLYQVEGDKPIRQKQTCPRCGQGVFLGEHSDRKTCGRCGYTETFGSGQPAVPAEQPSEQPQQESKEEPKSEEAPKEEQPQEKKEEPNSEK